MIAITIEEDLASEILEVIPKVEELIGVSYCKVDIKSLGMLSKCIEFAFVEKAGRLMDEASVRTHNRMAFLPKKKGG